MREKEKTMRKRDIKELIKNAINPRRICRVLMKYDEYYYHCFPLLAGDKLFLGANEDDFALDGFTVRRFRDTVKAEIKNDKCLEIAIKEGIVDNIDVPCINISDWYNVFVSLKAINKNIIVEKEDADEEECIFAIGKINRVTKTKVYFHHFDADGIWQDELWEIPFTEITSVSFGTRYVETFSKYV